MKMRAGLSVTSAIGALMIAAGFASTAQAADMVLKAPAPVAPAWWYDGYVEIGGRFFVDRSDKRTLAKYYEYRDLAPGVFGNFYIGAHRTNPLDIEAWGKNVGYDDQSYGLYLAKVGTFYGTVTYDETPHVYYMNGRTMFSGVGTGVLTVPLGVRTALNAAGPSAAGLAIVNANSADIDVKYRRDTWGAQFRWTPNENWDFNADYSHMHREGTQPLGTVSMGDPIGFSRGAFRQTRHPHEIPKPVDDVTQNANLKGEYSGATPWGTQFNFSAAYGVSLYSNDITSVSWQNPWTAVDGCGAGGLCNSVWQRYGLPPDNRAQNITLTGGVGLPMNSRYMATFQWSRMEQDEAFLPYTINPLIVPATLSAASLNGETTTLLFNNVLTTRWSQNVKSKLRYRYYDYDPDRTPVTLTGWFGNPDSNDTPEPPRTYIPTSYTKQNFDADVTWRAQPWLTFGFGYGWERWDRDFRDVNRTDEHTVRAFADAKWNSSTLRTSIAYSEREYDQYVNLGHANNNDAMRMRDLANRDRTVGKFSWAFEAMPVTITPLGGFRIDDYGTHPFGAPSEIGVTYADSWNVGGEVAFMWNTMARMYFSYIYENQRREVYQNNANPDLKIITDDKIHTVTFGTHLTLVPDKLMMDAAYSYSNSESEWSLDCTVNGCRYNPLAIYPDTRMNMHRLELKVKYYLDDAFVRHAGWDGKAFIKGRVLWEQVSTASWQNGFDGQLGYLIDPGSATTGRWLWTGTGAPNYSAVLMALSFGVKW